MKILNLFKRNVRVANVDDIKILQRQLNDYPTREEMAIIMDRINKNSRNQDIWNRASEKQKGEMLLYMLEFLREEKANGVRKR